MPTSATFVPAFEPIIFTTFLCAARLNTNTATEYRDLPLAVLTESGTNRRRIFEDSALKELADYVPRHIIGLMFRWLFCG